MENHQPEHEQLYLHNGQDEVREKYENGIPPGYRFVPDDVQLIDNYLKVIVDHPESGGVNGLIFTVNLYGSSPDELTAAHEEQCENNWYFFTKRNRKYANGNRPDRAAGDGYWKQTNVVEHIFRVGENNKRVKIGRKITLDYLCKRDSTDQDGSRTDWKMNEYRLDGANLPSNYNSAEFDEWCLCRLYISKSAKKTKDDNPQVNLQVEAEPNAGTQLIAPQEQNGHVAGEVVHNNFTGQSTAAALSDQNIIAQQQYNGGPGPNLIQQSTTMPFSNHAVWNPNNSNYMTNASSGSMSGLQYNTDALNDHQDMYRITATGYVQPLMSLPPGVFPTSSDYNFNQSSSGIPDHDVTSEWEFDFPSSLFPGNGQSSSEVDFTFDDFDL